MGRLGSLPARAVYAVANEGEWEVGAILAVFQQFGLPEILIILVILLFLFGARKLPELARSLGRSTKEFKTGLKEGAAEEDAPPTTDEAGKLRGSEEKPAAP